ncbi:DNA-deoxyinosine glycosylase [Tepidimonas taiwanensis]|uniref:DNA-deoxyinosine glycosylase n=1 Tax=Tepidimonas taiwanensis TaxID=307486 RepID=UPI00068A6045|nr:DNA-deoxyinosine glycosylase [Tepidimonas taiwanensis]MCX7693765.1 DNA-deoxyinosine glycosylase [Tepidimonas taiwanensis]MDM7464119.1 DNA-deoxyinosine glycosylase [Tepidimonas taiwanensis]
MNAPQRLRGLPPVLAPTTRLVVLGSFPSVASLQAGQYYAHPRNHFWAILGALWALPLTDWPYARRLEALHEHGVGLWDVYAECEREGSLDTAIRAPRLNDLASLRQQCPALRAIAHNGGESWRHARLTRALGVPVERLPSSSPANASWTLARKTAAWGAVLARHGVPVRVTVVAEGVDGAGAVPR